MKGTRVKKQPATHEFSNLIFRLSFRIEITSTFPTTHHQTSQSILEDLFESQAKETIRQANDIRERNKSAHFLRSFLSFLLSSTILIPIIIIIPKTRQLFSFHSQFQNRQVDSRMQPQPTLIRSQSTIKLNSISSVDL